MSDVEVVRVLTREESFEFLRTQALGRIVVRRKEDMDIFPINYTVDGEDIYFRTAEGNKLFSLTLNQDVLFEVDAVDETTATSVVIKGEAERVTDSAEIAHADSLPLRPWLPTYKYNYVRIRATKEVSGRHFQLGEEPQRY